MSSKVATSLKLHCITFEMWWAKCLKIQEQQEKDYRFKVYKKLYDMNR